jgi:hypothetical protein
MTIINFLKNLKLDDDNLFESIGQILDSTVQVIEEIIYDIKKEKSISNALGDLEKILIENGKLELAEKLSRIRKLRKSIDIKEPEIQKVDELRKNAISLIESAKAENQVYKFRVQYIPKLVNSSSLDSKNGFCKFNLYHGSISHISCNTLIISASEIENTFNGQVYNALNWLFDLSNLKPVSVLNIPNLKVSCYETKKLNTYFDHLIIINSNLDISIPRHDLENYYNHTFSFLQYLERIGVETSSIGITFLFGNSIIDKSEAIEILIQKSLEWLKHVNKSTTINCSIFYTSLVELFNNTMNQYLNRKYINHDSNPILNSLILDIKTILMNQEKGSLDEGVKPLFDALSVKDKINVELICTFSRTLCEIVVREIQLKHNIKFSGDLLNSIEKLRSENIIAPWISSYMHGIRILGNKSVHPMNQPPLYSPKSLDYNDLLISLTGIKAIIEFYNSNIKQ